MASGYTVGSLFSGIGGLDLAAHWAGFTTSWFVEREPFCQKVLAKHWAGVPIHNDVFECHDLPHVDVIVGGFPCQPFSVAGNRKGADDERYLLPEMLRIIREVKPYAVLFENVPGFPSLNDGAEFKYLLRALAEMGFNAEWGHLRASDCGAPHQRERWFLVAYASGSRTGMEEYRNRGQGWQHAGTLQPANLRQEHRAVSSEGINSISPLMADTTGIRRERHSTGQGQNRFQQGRTSQFTRGNQTQLGNTQCRRSARITRRGAGAQLANGYARDGRSTESRFRGTLDGFPSGMDFVGWPARPGEDQHPYEPSRVTSAKTPDRAARLKALGNAVVPQVAYPLFVAIHEWLAEIETGTQRTDGVA